MVTIKEIFICNILKTCQETQEILLCDRMHVISMFYKVLTPGRCYLSFKVKTQEKVIYLATYLSLNINIIN